MIQLHDPPSLEIGRGVTFLPLVMGPPLESGPIDPLSPEARIFFDLLINDPRQTRQLTLCPSLIAAATARATGLATVDPWAHVDRNGVWPNLYARRAGCRLPDFYPDDANFIECLVAGSWSGEAAFIALARSEKHSVPLFGLADFFRDQIHIGLAVAEGSAQYQWYWSILIGLCL